MVTPLRVVLWDLDGTLVDSEWAHVRLDQRVLSQLGVTCTPERLQSLVGLSTADVYRRVLAAAGRPELLDAARSLRLQLATEVLVERVVPCRGAERALAALPAREVPFGLVTATEGPLVDGLLDRFGWRWRFDAIVTAEDVTLAKPAPEPYLLACERLGVDPGCALVVEDSSHGVASARAAGCRVAAVTHTLPAAALQGADYVLSGLGAVAGLFSALA